MLDLTAVQAAELTKQALRLVPFFYFDFLSGPGRYWLGPGDRVIDGVLWIGKPIILGIDFGTPSTNGTAENFTIHVSGVDATFLAAVEANNNEIRNRRCDIYFQFFNDRWAELDAMFLVRSGKMLGLAYQATSPLRAITIRCESRFVARGMAPLTYLSDQEQQRRFPGDGGLSRISNLQNKVVQWPTFLPA